MERIFWISKCLWRAFQNKGFVSLFMSLLNSTNGDCNEKQISEPQLTHPQLSIKKVRWMPFSEWSSSLRRTKNERIKMNDCILLCEEKKKREID